MNLVKTAEDLKNLSDQQLMSAGQNPVVVPPYLVLAEMKRREQMRAEYAKATQQQGQKPTVAQQTAQGLMQGQSQPQQPQQPQPQGQGIMQAMPQGGASVQAMAGGGQVHRYAKGDAVIPEGYADLAEKFKNIPITTPVPPTLTREQVMADIAKAYQPSGIAEEMQSARGILGAPDYSQYEAYLQQQIQEAKTKKPRLGDALIAAGAAMAANRDPRVGIANILAQGIGAGSEAYRAQQEKQKKDLQTAMMAQMALKKMKQEDLGKQVELAGQMAGNKRGWLISQMQVVESKLQNEQKNYLEAKSDSEKLRTQAEIKRLELLHEGLKNTLDAQQRKEELAYQRGTAFGVANIGSAARSASKDSVGATIDDLQKYAGAIQGDIQSQYKILETARRQDIPEIQERIKALTAKRASILNVIESAMMPRLGMPVVPRVTQGNQQK